MTHAHFGEGSSLTDYSFLPVGDIIYMGPVNLNKDKLLNPSGMEVDVIPIMKSPASSPKVKKKQQKRAKSEMGFYKTSKLLVEDDRGSLPDIKSSSTASLYDTIIRMTPERFLGHSNESSLASDVTSQSLDRLPPRNITAAVNQWLEKSSPFSSTDNMSVSLHDTGSVLDEDWDKVPDIVISDDSNNNTKPNKPPNLGKPKIPPRHFRMR